jgi:hypothetical protein
MAAPAAAATAAGMTAASGNRPSKTLDISAATSGLSGVLFQLSFKIFNLQAHLND